ncbi:hypothetical protein MHK_009731 [Candidatus Magnetomorum sp. HK-1]|nr:hypothetical protein MHK_009731 [Candidatus Magnetomorum sp. HK-1]
MENGRLLMSRNIIGSNEFDSCNSLENGRLLMSRNKHFSSGTAISFSLENGRLLMSRNILFGHEAHWFLFGKWPAFDVTEPDITNRDFI